MAQAILCATNEINTELARLRQELEIVAELSRKELHRITHSLENQKTSNRQIYLERYEQARERIETLEQKKLERTAKSKAIGHFIRNICRSAELITEFDETLWNAIAESITVMKEARLVFRFNNNLEIVIEIL